MNELKFGVNVRSVDADSEFAAFVRRVDALGFDILAVPDHLGGPAPFATLGAAAMLSDRLRLRTYVLNVGFWNPALLAREIATLDALSLGRAELGIGAGHMRSEHDDARLPWYPLRERVAIMERTVVEVRDRLSDEAHIPQPVQRPIPVVIGAMSEVGLTVAARHADVIAISGLRQIPGEPIGTFALASADDTAATMHGMRAAVDGREVVFDFLVQAVSIDRDPRQAAAELVRGTTGMTVEQILDSPFVVLAADADEAAAELRRRQHVYGFTQITTHQSNLEALGQVAAACRSEFSDRADRV